MGILFKMAQPQIPGGLLHTMYELQSGGKYDQDQGGQWVPTPDQRTAFQGVVLPVSDVDLRREITGTVTDRSENIYTNGHALKVGAEGGDQLVTLLCEGHFAAAPPLASARYRFKG